MARRPLSWLVALVLLSAGGLVALGVVSLWRALRNAEAAGRAEARQAAQATARAVRAVIASPAFAERFPEERRFELGPEGPKVPEALRPRPSAGDVSFTVESLIGRAEQLALGQDETREALRLLRDALASDSLSAAERAAVALAAAWHLHRSGEPGDRDALLGTLQEQPPDPTLVGSLLLLIAHAKRDLPPWIDAELTRLDATRAAALLDRLGEIGIPAARLRALRALATVAAQRRSMLELVAGRAAKLLDTDRPATETHDGHVLLFQPGGKGAGGRGAFVPEKVFTRELRAAATDGTIRAVAWSGTLVYDAMPTSDSVAAAPGIWIRPASAAGASPWRPWQIGLTLAALTLCLVLGIALMLRTLRREREALATRNDFLSSVTHELKTPLSSIRMFAELLEEGRVGSPEKQQQYYRLLASESGRLTALVENVLDLGRIERGERSYDRRPVELAEVLERSLEIFAPVADRAGLTVDRGSTPAVRVRVDHDAVVQALLNLFDNASKYAVGGSRLAVGVAVENGTVEVRVGDDGPGVLTEEREAIFERFRRGAAQRDGAVPGVGLGLYLSRCIARAHGGELSCVEPAEGTGACFVLRLPTDRGEPS